MNDKPVVITITMLPDGGEKWELEVPPTDGNEYGRSIYLTGFQARNLQLQLGILGNAADAFRVSFQNVWASEPTA